MPSTRVRPAPVLPPHIVSERSLQPVSGLSVLRAVVCLSIVARHCYFNAGQLHTFDQYFGRVGFWVAYHLRPGFETFFVLAGYMLAQSFHLNDGRPLSISGLLRRRVVRLAIPYWSAIALGAGATALASILLGWPRETPAVWQLWPMLLFVHDVIPTGSPTLQYWFLASLLQFYLLWSIVFWVTRRKYLADGDAAYHERSLRIMKFLSVVTLYISLTCVIARVDWRWKLPSNAAFICLGILAFWRDGRRVKVTFVLGLATTTAAGIWLRDSRLLSAAVAAVIIDHLRHRPSLPDWLPLRMAAMVGTWSYSIYLTHMHVALLFINMPAYFGKVPTPAGLIGVWAMTVLASVAVGYAFYLAIERPVIHLSRRIRYRGN
jgi:peptidoglycan/LPS O-acetylase OafA/YrhL